MTLALMIIGAAVLIYALIAAALLIIWARRYGVGISSVVSWELAVQIIVPAAMFWPFYLRRMSHAK